MARALKGLRFVFQRATLSTNAKPVNTNGLLSKKSGIPRKNAIKCFLLTLRCTNNNEHHFDWWHCRMSQSQYFSK